MVPTFRKWIIKMSQITLHTGRLKDSLIYPWDSYLKMKMLLSNFQIRCWMHFGGLDGTYSREIFGKGA